MLLVLSPAKKINEMPVEVDFPLTVPQFLPEAEQLVDVMRSFDAEALRKLMGVSEAIAQLNVRRFTEFATPLTPDTAVAALHLFKGDVYASMAVDAYGAEDLAFADAHVRILSGLYGLLRPCDLALPYRLEMGTRLENAKGKNLYAFWGDKIAEALKDALAKSGSNLLVNLASEEYFKAVPKAALGAPILNIQFKEKKPAGYKIISFAAKRARGMMADYIIRERINDAKGMEAFTVGGYQFRPDMSDYSQDAGGTMVFTREGK